MRPGLVISCSMSVSVLRVSFRARRLLSFNCHLLSTCSTLSFVFEKSPVADTFAIRHRHFPRRKAAAPQHGWRSPSGILVRVDGTFRQWQVNLENISTNSLSPLNTPYPHDPKHKDSLHRFASRGALQPSTTFYLPL